MKPSILLLFSGGLDSMLSAKVLQDAGADVTAVTFVSAFFNAEKAEKSAKTAGIPIITEDITKEHLKIVKNPPHGWGKAINPCIDCHSLMLKVAAKIAKKEGFDAIATGEVVGQRPFSQRKQALEQIEKITGLKNKILRPLSAKLLPETEIEKSGKIDRNKLLDIEGRSRKRQMELVSKYGIKEYETPAGGCILTDPEYSIRAKELLKINPKAKPNDFEILRYGRFFTINGNIVLVGRSQDENQKLTENACKNDVLISIIDYSGPTGLLRVFNKKSVGESIEFTKDKVKSCAPKAREISNLKFQISN